MKRRKFINQSGFIISAITIGGAISKSCSKPEESAELKAGFKLKFAPHFSTFKNLAGKDLIGQLEFISSKGFTAFEDNNMRTRNIRTQEKIASKMVELGLEMGVFVAHTIHWDTVGLASGNKEMQTEFLKEIRQSIVVAKRVNAKWMTVVPGCMDRKMMLGYQTSNVVDSLKRAAELLQTHNLTMVIEPLNQFDHPGQFLNNVAQAYSICKEVDSERCKILFDIYHQQRQCGNIINNIINAWDEIGYFQCADNPGRNEPSTGEVNFTNIFKHIHNKSYTGIIGMEHNSFRGGFQGERNILATYREIDSLL